MKMFAKIAGALLGLVLVAALGLALALARTEDCPAPLADADSGAVMAAIRYQCYGSPEVLEYTRVQQPAPAENEVLVAVKAAGVNPLDWHYMRGSPFIMRLMSGMGAPADDRLGVDFAGTVVAKGDAVTKFEIGDRVFGGANGAFAEYVTVREDRAIARIPGQISFESAAGIPIAGLTALQALRDHGKLKAGQRVLINGASGGVGTYAVQIARAIGAHVTGVCSGRNVEMVKSIGADQVFNYREENYTDSGQTFDLIVDMVGNHSPLDNRKVLTPEGRLVIVGGQSGDWLGPLVGPISAAATNLFVAQELKSFTATLRGDDLEALAALMADGSVTTVIDRRFPLAETAEAIRYSESGRARGKIIMRVP